MLRSGVVSPALDLGAATPVAILVREELRDAVPCLRQGEPPAGMLAPWVTADMAKTIGL